MTTHTNVFAPMQGFNDELVTQLIGDIFSAGGEIWDLAAREQQRRQALWNLLGQSSKGMTLDVFKDEVVSGTSGTSMTFEVLKPLMAELNAIKTGRALKPRPAHSEVHNAVLLTLNQPSVGMPLSTLKAAPRVIGVRVR